MCLLIQLNSPQLIYQQILHSIIYSHLNQEFHLYQLLTLVILEHLLVVQVQIAKIRIIMKAAVEKKER